MLKTWPKPVFEKNSYPAENAGNCRFCRFSSDFFLMFLCFFHRKTLLITMPTIKHESIVNKTDFCCRNSLKIAGTADFRRKTVFFEFLELYFIFFHEILHTDAKCQYLKYDWARFSKMYFYGRKCRKYAGFLAFSRYFIISFLRFLAHYI